MRIGQYFWVILCALCLCSCTTLSKTGRSSVSTYTDAQRRADLHTQLAALYFQNQSIAVALEEAQMALDIDPGYAPAHAMLALIYMALDDAVSAQDAFRRSLKLNPKDMDVLNNYAWFLCQKGDFSNSFQYFEQAIALEQSIRLGKVYANMGLCSLEEGKERQAGLYFKQALAIEEHNITVLLRYSELLLKQKKFEDAQHYLDRYHQLTQPSAYSAFLAVKLAKAQRDDSMIRFWSAVLNRNFPGSEENQFVIRGEF